MNKKDKNSNSQISDFINITYASDFMDVVYKNCYIKQVEKILKDNNIFDSIVKDIRLLNKKYEQDGSYVFNKFVENLKTKKYPKNIENQIIEEFKHAFLVKVYEKEEKKIENNPERIITKITAENFNTKELTIYDLNKKELEAYNKGMEVRSKKEEEKQIELVKKDPREIYKIENPSTLVRNYAINAFRRKWER